MNISNLSDPPPPPPPPLTQWVLLSKADTHIYDSWQFACHVYYISQEQIVTFKSEYIDSNGASSFFSKGPAWMDPLHVTFSQWQWRVDMKVTSQAYRVLKP